MDKSKSNNQNSKPVGLSKTDIQQVLEKIVHISLLLTEQSHQLENLGRELMEFKGELTLTLTDADLRDSSMELSQKSQYKGKERRFIQEIRFFLTDFVHRLKSDENLQHCKPELALLNAYLEELNHISDNPFSSVDTLSHLNGKDSLTLRERKVLLMIQAGMNTEKIADHLHISPDTIKTHRRNIRKKLHIVGKQSDLSSFLKSADRRRPKKRNTDQTNDAKKGTPGS